MTLPALPAGPVIESLAALLAEVAPRRGPDEAARAAARLDRLEYDARWQGAAETTLAAIAGTRLLLGLGAARLSSPGAGEARP